MEKLNKENMGNISGGAVYEAYARGDNEKKIYYVVTYLDSTFGEHVCASWTAYKDLKTAIWKEKQMRFAGLAVVDLLQNVERCFKILREIKVDY